MLFCDYVHRYTTRYSIDWGDTVRATGWGQHIFTALFNFTDVLVYYTGNRFGVGHGTSDSLLVTEAFA